MRFQLGVQVLLAMVVSLVGVTQAQSAETDSDVYQQHLIATLMHGNVANMHGQNTLASPQAASPEFPDTDIAVDATEEFVEQTTVYKEDSVASTTKMPLQPTNKALPSQDVFELKTPAPMLGAKPLPVHEKLFRLGPGDEIQVTVWGYPELSEKVVILPDGTVSYPLLGMFVASGYTVGDLSEAMQTAFAKHIQSPQVNVSIVQMRGRRFSITGDVRQAGTYPLWGENVMVLEGIAQAGGWNSSALLETAKIYRVNARNTTDVIELDLRDLLNNLSGREQPLLHPGDVVHIPSQADQRKICVLGQVAQPGLYPMTRDMTVVEALSAAGWVQSSAGMKSVIIARRKANGEHEFFTANVHRAVKKQDWSQHLPLLPGDIVFVPEKFISKMAGVVKMFTSTVEPAANTYLRTYDATDPATVLINR